MGAKQTKERYILKLGGSVITDKKSKYPKVNYKVLDRLSREISEGYYFRDIDLAIIHGAGSYAHDMVKNTGIDRGVKTREGKISFGKVQKLQNELSCIVTEYLINADIPAIPCQASSHAVMQNQKLKYMSTEVIEGLFNIGMIPVIAGTPAYDVEQNCSILSSDEIAPYLARKVKANKIIHGTDVDGICTSDPKLNPKAKLIEIITKDNFEEIEKFVGGSSNTDVTGGMRRKLNELKELLDCRIESYIINALVPKNVEKALKGEHIKGTIIKL